MVTREHRAVVARNVDTGPDGQCAKAFLDLWVKTGRAADGEWLIPDANAKVWSQTIADAEARGRASRGAEPSVTDEQLAADVRDISGAIAYLIRTRPGRYEDTTLLPALNRITAALTRGGK